MYPAFFPARRGLVLASALLAAASIARANDYDELVRGDLSDNPSAPTDIGSLTPGSNRISGATVPSGTFDAALHSYSILDNDYVTFAVPTGYALSAIVVGTDSVIQSSDRLFFAIAQGAEVSVDRSFESASGLLGWTLVGAPMTGTDVLPALGAAAPANFPAVGGATGFAGPLPQGQYTLWMLDGDAPAAYDFKLSVVPAVPEASSWAMLLTGLATTGFALRRRARPPEKR